MKIDIAPLNQWDWPRGIFTSALIVCAVWMLTGCSLNRSVSEGDCVCPERLAEVQPAWHRLAIDVASFGDQRPSAITFTEDGRAFFAFPWAEDEPAFGVVELMPDGTTQPYPSIFWNSWDGNTGATALRSFVSVQSIYADQQGYLWVLDSGNPRNRQGVIAGGAKLAQIDLESNKIIDIVYFDAQQFLSPDSYLSGLCVDAERQAAYMLDASNGEVIVVDFKAGSVFRVFEKAPIAQVKDASDLFPETTAFVTDLAEWTAYATGLQPSRTTLAGLALSNDGEWLYYHTTGEALFRLPTDQLLDRSLNDTELLAASEQIEHPFQQVSGIWVDTNDQLYLIASGEDTVYTLSETGKVERVLSDPRLDQAEALTIGPDGYVYFSALKRDAIKVPSGEEPEYTGVVMKFSPDKIELAKQLRADADDLHAEAAWYTQLAEEAEQSVAYRERKTPLQEEAIEQERIAANELRARSQMAREAAAYAEQLAIEAEYAEIAAPTTLPADAVADVPTQTE